MPIQVLPDHLIAKIAAGEVVERPASVVKELLENALDAGAGYIQVDIQQGGRRLIRVSDDGSGINQQEAPLAVTRHATSKLSAADDLTRILTLGFRGEALASIAAVSLLTLSTRHRDEDVGTEIRVAGGELMHQKAVGAPAGTVISVENLFYNTPARLKFLKAEATEKRQIATLISRYAMAYPQVRFVLTQDNREQFRSPGSGRLADVVVRVMGVEAFERMIDVYNEEPLPTTGEAIRVTGYASLPEFTRNDRTRIVLFINGRAVQDHSLVHAVTQAYHGLIDRSRYPYAVLMLDVPPDFVDVNVHPTKAEVRFQDANVIFAALQRAVRTALVLALEQSGYPPHERVHDPATRPRPAQGWQRPYESDASDASDTPYQDAPFQTEMGLTFDETSPRSTAEAPAANAPNDAPESAPAQRPRTLPVLRVVGQVGAAYIVAEGPAGMYLIDQHAAHWRLLYNAYQEALNADHLPLIEAETRPVDLSPEAARTLEAALEPLQAMGFTLEPFGPASFRLRTLPEFLSGHDAADILRGLVEALSADDPQEAITQHVSQRAALTAGEILSNEDMRALVQQLERAPNPLQGPDGRPTLIHMSAEQIAHQFSR